MEVDDLRMFTVVVSCGSLTQAARQFGVPTSTISRRLSRLEESAGARLLQRTTRAVRLTQAGQLLLDCSGRILAEVDDAERLLTELGGAPRGRVRVTAPVEDRATIRLVSRFLAAYPATTVELELTNRVVNLVDERFDAALRAGHLPESTLVAQKIMDAGLWLVASPAYLARRGEPASIAELAQHDAIAFGGAFLLNGADGPVRVPVRGRLSVNHLQAVRSAAIEGLGIAQLPAMYVLDDLASGQLRALLPDATPPTLPVWIVYPERRFLHPAVRAFIDFTRQNFKAILEKGPD